MPLQEGSNLGRASGFLEGMRGSVPEGTFGAPPARDEPPAREAPAAPTRERAGRLRVLVVEDNRDAADSLRDLLEAIGYEVAVAYTGPDGVTAALRCLPHVVLCDLGLPGLDGYGVAASLKGDERTTHARLFALTGYNRDEDRRRSKEVGFEMHLVKPVDLDHLEHLLALAAAALPLHEESGETW